MRNKVIFITDGDSPSGHALADRFSRSGAHLILGSAAGGKELEKQSEAYRANGSKTLVVHADLCSSRDIAAMLDDAEQQLGPVDVLIHNNSLIRPADVETCDESNFVDMLRANAKSAFFCAQTFGKRMAVRKSGCVVFAGSIHDEKPTGASFPFSVSQAAVQMLAREAALFLGRHGVRVNLIEMGPAEGADVAFPSTLSGLYDSYRCKVPIGALATFGDLAELAFFLTQEESKHINGANIRLDGGFVLHYMDHKMNRHDQRGAEP